MADFELLPLARLEYAVHFNGMQTKVLSRRSGLQPRLKRQSRPFANIRIDIRDGTTDIGSTCSRNFRIS